MRKLFSFSASCLAIYFSLACVVTQAQELTVNSISATDRSIATMGRIVKNADGSAQFAFPGVSFFINFEGKKLSLDAMSSGGQNYIEAIVDGGQPKIIKLSAKEEHIDLVESAVAQKHRVQIIHRSETWHGVVSFKKFTTDGKFSEAPALPKLKIMVLGDSVTCSEAIDRVDGGKKDTSWWNPRLSYGMLTANAFNAQVNLVCMGGRGLIRSWNGKTDENNLPDFYQFALATDKDPIKWDHSQYDPDLIISAIGTNDFSSGIPDRETYVNTYVKLLLSLLTNHKHAQIVLMEGSILDGDKKAALIGYLNEAKKRVDDKRVHIVKANHYPGDKTDGHPTKEQHALMAKDLIPQVKAIMKW
ncbi:acetylxylan esterase [Cellvibrio zantedeschiae]|uniref:Acetylxylan esterase n=1 Tax=Cellvibrio zantedeschiae TaxID=1237077 RepID=A0ABQ3B8N6_9GAMM|nr:bifunctional acetylxylan esterase/glucomannan deacetylase AxeC2 [Cellvibrio zantedeschiae]GGY80260.1 acetylxylan esterase [Cellvibrio zantedeschiae]